MERTVPSTASEEIELFLRTVYSLLRSTTEVRIRTLEEVHAGMNSSLHPDARRPAPDTSAFIYSLLRLPPCMREVDTVVLGQSSLVFTRHGYGDVESWQPVSARARRRRCYYNGSGTLACFIASKSDIDDVVPVLTAYQIEWNKIHNLLQRYPHDIGRSAHNALAFEALAAGLQMSIEDLERLRVIWGEQFIATLEQMAARRCNLNVHLLNGSLREYRRATSNWWHNIEQNYPALLERPVYFISSNTHSIANLVSGFALQQKDTLIELLKRQQQVRLLKEWDDIQSGRSDSSEANFLYYALKVIEQSEEGSYLVDLQLEQERRCGIVRIPSEHSFDVDAQVIDLARINSEHLDPRLRDCFSGLIKDSDSLILNLDYPLGMAAYNILTEIAENILAIKGIYIMGKAATLNGVMGDVMIPNVVQDEHSRNTFLFHNAFTAGDLAPYLAYSSVLDNQKSVSVLGTYLQNARVMDVVYREGYTDIEMEAGPFLSAIYEITRPERYPINEIVNLYGVPFDIGILHYASDTPLSKGKNLGAGTLSYYGIDSTYATSIAILRRIFVQENEARGAENL